MLSNIHCGSVLLILMIVGQWPVLASLIDHFSFLSPSAGDCSIQTEILSQSAIKSKTTKLDFLCYKKSRVTLDLGVYHYGWRCEIVTAFFL